MLGLPASTEIKKVITKKKVYEHFAAEMSAERRKSFDADIARIVLMNEISPVSLNLADGDEVHAFFIMHVMLRQKDFDQKNIAFIARMFGQHLVIVLQYEDEQRLALWQTRLMMNDWISGESVALPLNGLNMDTVWEGVVTAISGIAPEQGRTLNEQIAVSDQRAKLLKQIEKLEKQARAEKQPKRKFELVQKINKMKIDLEGEK